MGRSHYLATIKGDEIIALPSRYQGTPFANVLSIPNAEGVLADHRAAAWGYAEEGRGIYANTLLEYANELAEALDDAAVQRAKCAAAANPERAAA